MRDGERNLITADTRPCDLCMEDYELLEARFEPASSASSSGQQLQAATMSPPPHPRSPSAAVSGRKSKRTMPTDHDGEEEEEEEGKSLNGSRFFLRCALNAFSSTIMRS